MNEILTHVLDTANPEFVISLLISLNALVVSIIALYFTAKIYLLKSGAEIRGSFIWTSSISCDDKYISNITLENLKDRSIAIFQIYLKLGHNYYIQIDDFENDPLIIKPFEIFRKEYDPIDFYSINLNRLNMNQLIEKKHTATKIVLSTSDGKYIVNSWIDHWNPIIDSLNDYMTAVIYPIRSRFKDKSYGSNSRYIVELRWKNGVEEIVPIYNRDHEVKKFKKFDLTKEALQSKEKLEDFLEDKINKGLLSCDDLLVHDIESWRNEIYDRYYSKELIDAPYYNWLTYNITGPMMTKLRDSKLFDKLFKKRKKEIR